MRERIQGDMYRTTLVCVETYRDGLMSGTLSHPCLPEGTRFENVLQFLLKMEDLLDSMRLPQAFTARRAFRTPPERRGPPEDQARRSGAAATFTVRVLFRQNASWQGSVTWMETGQEESFRSALELLLLINGALESNQKAPCEKTGACLSVP